MQRRKGSSQMGDERSGHTVRQLSANDADYLPAIHIALDARPTGRGNAAEAVSELRAAAGRQANTPLMVFGGYRSRRLQGGNGSFPPGVLRVLRIRHRHS